MTLFAAIGAWLRLLVAVLVILVILAYLAPIAIAILLVIVAIGTWMSLKQWVSTFSFWSK